MRPFSIYLCFLFLYGVFAASACNKEEKYLQKKAMMEAALEEKLINYKTNHAEKCRTNIMAKAKIIVDSTMLANARNIKVVDSLDRPPKPTKPGVPTPKSLTDTSEVAPLLPID